MGNVGVAMTAAAAAVGVGVGGFRQYAAQYVCLSVSCISYRKPFVLLLEWVLWATSRACMGDTHMRGIDPWEDAPLATLLYPFFFPPVQNGILAAWILRRGDTTSVAPFICIVFGCSLRLQTAKWVRLCSAGCAWARFAFILNENSNYFLWDYRRRNERKNEPGGWPGVRVYSPNLTI